MSAAYRASCPVPPLEFYTWLMPPMALAHVQVCGRTHAWGTCMRCVLTRCVRKGYGHGRGQNRSGKRGTAGGVQALPCAWMRVAGGVHSGQAWWADHRHCPHAWIAWRAPVPCAVNTGPLRPVTTPLLPQSMRSRSNDHVPHVRPADAGAAHGPPRHAGAAAGGGVPPPAGAGRAAVRRSRGHTVRTRAGPGVWCDAGTPAVSGVPWPWCVRARQLYGIVKVHPHIARASGMTPAIFVAHHRGYLPLLVSAVSTPNLGTHRTLAFWVCGYSAD